MEYLLLVVMYLSVPAFIIWFSTVNKVVEKIGAILITFNLGLIIGNIGIIPEYLSNFQYIFLEISVALALPLILFSSDFNLWIKILKKTALSFFLGLVSILTILIVGFYIFEDKIENIWKITGMLSALYIGDSSNFIAVKTALEVDQNIFIITQTSDLAFAAIFLLFLLSIGQKTFGLFLSKFSLKKHLTVNENLIDTKKEFIEYKNFFKKRNIVSLLIAFSLSILIIVFSSFVGLIVPKSISITVVIMLITTIGLSFSFIKKVRRLNKSFELGNYFMVVFNFILASKADLSEIFQPDSLNLFYYVIFSVFFSFTLFAILSKIFKIDTDTFVITGVALIYSVPFVPVVAGAFKNKHIILSGIVIALIGCSISNYIGVFVAYLLK